MQQSEKRWVGYPLGHDEPGAAYRIYPSLLDKYQDMLDYEELAERPWNIVSETAKMDGRYPDKEIGDYILVPEDMYAKTEQELLDTINRLPHAPSEAADKGTAFNEVIDCIIKNTPCQREDMKISSVRDPKGKAQSIIAEYDGFLFNFDKTLYTEVAGPLEDALCQVLLQAPIDTRYGTVILYGYADYILRDKIIDLKTTSQYDFGNYSRRWQRHLYPWCAVRSGVMQSVSEFVYYVAQLGKGKIIKGKVYEETYTYCHEQSEHLLRSHIESFIRWLEQNRDKITDTKIFNKLDSCQTQSPGQ